MLGELPRASSMACRPGGWASARSPSARRWWTTPPLRARVWPADLGAVTRTTWSAGCPLAPRLTRAAMRGLPLRYGWSPTGGRPTWRIASSPPSLAWCGKCARQGERPGAFASGRRGPRRRRVATGAAARIEPRSRWRPAGWGNHDAQCSSGGRAVRARRRRQVANLATAQRFVARAAEGSRSARPECCLTGYWHLRRLSRERCSRWRSRCRRVLPPSAAALARERMTIAAWWRPTAPLQLLRGDAGRRGAAPQAARLRSPHLSGSEYCL